ncbi:MAG TPA: AAA family ATPase [Candidatus Limnocylindrales bacterium]|nr:AAA family ATPase [Candidatus Limnocylindrales bacterium]
MTELLVPDSAVVLLVGAAGSGKSTFAARHFPAGSVLSSDHLREAISGDAANQAVSRAAFAALHRALEQRLAAGLLSVVDATNIGGNARAAIRRIARRHGAPVVAIVLDLEPEVVLARNGARVERQVPDGAVANQLARLAATLARGDLATEGYAFVVRLRDAAAVEATRIRIVPTTPTAPGGAGP